jgi:hypothetical protein
MQNGIGILGKYTFRNCNFNSQYIFIKHCQLICNPELKMAKGKQRDFSILNEQHVIGLLKYLSERDHAYGYDLLEVSGNYVKLKGLAEKLEKKGLVDIAIEEKPRLTYVYRLTEKGKRVTDKLVEIERIINE